MQESKIEKLEHQQYRLVGNHSAVKICYWCKRSIKCQGECFKNDFYGIPTHRCLEMTPSITCNKRCKHCWRDNSIFSKSWEGKIDDPKFIVEESVKARLNLLNGFPASPYVNKEKLKEAFTPTHAAISLTGEPLMYPKISELIKEFFRHNFKTVFLVTSGTVPEALNSLEVLPTNIYLSVEGYDKELYNKLCSPVIEDAWEKFNESLEIFSKLKTRSVMKITCIKFLNMDSPDKFLTSVNKMNPDLIACKSYAFMGYSKNRLKNENSPTYKEVYEFSEQLSKVTNYEIVASRIGTDIVLLRRKSKRIIDNQEFIYENKEKEVERINKYLEEIKSEL